MFSTNFREMLKYKILWKPVQWEPSCPCVLTDGQTGITKLIVSFRVFTKAPKVILCGTCRKSLAQDGNGTCCTWRKRL